MSRRSIAQLGVLAAAAVTLACAPSLKDEYPFDVGTTGCERLCNSDLENGVVRTVVNATSKDAWLAVDLDTGAEVPTDDPGWDLEFQRFKIFSNSGVHGSGGVGVAVLPEQDFDALQQAPAEDQFQSDVDDPNGENDSPFLAGDGWYAYDLLKHQLSARNTTYVVRTTDGAYVKLRIEAYYDASGTAGMITFRHATIAPAP